MPVTMDGEAIMIPGTMDIMAGEAHGTVGEATGGQVMPGAAVMPIRKEDGSSVQDHTEADASLVREHVPVAVLSATPQDALVTVLSEVEPAPLEAVAADLERPLPEAHVLSETTEHAPTATTGTTAITTTMHLHAHTVPQGATLQVLHLEAHAPSEEALSEVDTASEVAALAAVAASEDADNYQLNITR